MNEASETSEVGNDLRPDKIENEIVESLELLNVLDCEDIGTNAADIGDDSQEFLYADIEVAAESGAGGRVIAAGDAPAYAMLGGARTAATTSISSALADTERGTMDR